MGSSLDSFNRYFIFTVSTPFQGNQTVLFNIPFLTTSSKPCTKPSLLLINFQILPFYRLILGRFSSCILYYLLKANQLAGFYIRGTLKHNGLQPHHSHTSCRSSHLEVFLGKHVQKICSKFTGEHLRPSAIMQLYRNHTLAWVFSCKFAAYFHVTFS